MMNFISRSHNKHSYKSVTWFDSEVMPGARFAIRRISLAGRIELLANIRDLCLKHEFLRAGDHAEQSEAALADLLVHKLYLEWGLKAVEGLYIDGAPADFESLLRNGPEDLAEEIISYIRAELGLTDDERKNS